MTQLISASALPYTQDDFQRAAAALVPQVRALGQAGWTPATSSNFSMRIDATHLAITISGRDKSQLVADDLMVVDLTGAAVGSTAKPSAETLLHTQLYARFAEINCVLHTHSLTQTVASRLFAKQGHVQFAGYELQKAFVGQHSHEGAIYLPVLPNSQDMPTLAAQVEALLDTQQLWGYLIDGHGLYAWGRSVQEARRHLDAFEFLLQCELELSKYR